MLIFDEAQILKLDILRVLLKLSVFERGDGQVVFVFCGNNELLKPRRVSEDTFAQIDRRVQFRKDLRRITYED
ncbi:hypothetical protein MWN34_01350 [Ancylobacter sp. 6x-1]|uniref:AAA domain-containing protein n=1 Tax=Ancylobacter crimeensis TaxID=2579147 RepID=A0ABT0D6H5_9HYPH|nr:hypothetical protein [Ancylobacter crimeensis]MCK0195552.1 hypothetical protein [Ancylobacter crimeensis]